MSEHVIEIEGQAIPIDAETASSDDNLKQALRGFYPEIANATINRRTEGAREIIIVVKRAGTKGAGENSDELNPAITSDQVISRKVLARLRAAKPTRNPATSLAAKLLRAQRRGTLTADVIIASQIEIAEAVLAGDRQAREAVSACEQLKQSPASPSQTLPAGF